MPTPPITLGELANVPAPGSGVTSAWAQDVSQRVVMRFANTAARDAAFPPAVGSGPLLQEPFNTFTNWAVTGSPVPAIVAGRNGTGAQVQNLSSNTGILSYSIPTPSQSADIVVGTAFKTSDMSSDTHIMEFWSDTNSTFHCHVGARSDGSIGFSMGGILLGWSAAALLTVNTFAYVEAKVHLADSPNGTWTLRINGAVVASGTGADTKNSGTKTVFDAVRLTTHVLGTITSIYDDLYIDTGAAAAFRGDPGAVSPPSSAVAGMVAYTAADDSYWGYGTSWTKLSGGSSSGIAVASIVELATTPVGTAYELRWSSLHQAMMRWSGTQWVFASGPPPYYNADDMWGQSGVGNFTPTPLTVGGNTILADSPPHYGINRATSGNATVSGESYRGAGSITNLSAGAGLRMRGVFSLPNIAVNTVQRIGFHDWSVPATPPVDGAWLDIVTGVASFKTSAASTVSTHATTATLGVGNWYIVHIWFPTATTARCIVILETGAVVLDVTNTTNVPTGANKFGVAAAAVFNANVTGTILLDVDWMGWGYASI